MAVLPPSMSDRDGKIWMDGRWWIGAMPIRELDRIELGGGSRGPMTEKIQSAFFDIVNGRNPHYMGWLSQV